MNYEINSNEIINFLSKVFQSGDVFEIRVLEAITKAFPRPHIESGYFDYDHINIIPDELKHISFAKGIYVTVNPVKNDLLARANNRIRVPGKEPVTSDGDVLCRRWLLIDCDAKRVSGVSSTEEEHSFALAKAQEIKTGFNSIGWPMPIEIDSGNGAQLMYKVDLPVDDNNIIHNILKNIAVISDEHVDVDVTVHNPARIWRLPGTWNCKGDNVDFRPHRMSRVLCYPHNLISVSLEQLEKSAKQDELTPVAKVTTQLSNVSYHENFDIDNWINTYLPDLGSPKAWNNGRKWVFDVCPFNDSHTDKSACLIEQNNGAIAFTCHHNSCQGNDWHKLREMFEPNCYEKKTVEYPKIDLDAFLKSFNKKVENKENPFEYPGEITDELLNVPGLVSDIAQLSLKTAPYPNKTLASCAAISFVAHISGRKFRDQRNNFTNLYLIALANSGTGKDHPRKVNIELANHVQLGGTIGDAFASGAGLEDFMYMSPASLFQIDEVDWLFNVMKGSNKDTTMAESINEKLLKFYGESNSTYYMRKKAVSFKDDSAQLNSGMIHNPCLNLYGTAVPSYFYESMSKRVLENGLIARCMIVETSKRGRGGNSCIIDKHITEEMLDKIKSITTRNTETDYMGKPKVIYEIPETEEATELLLHYRHQCDDNYSMFESIKEFTAMALWARVMEKVYKLSMIYAISENPSNPLITVSGVTWAFKFAEYATKLLLFRAGQYCYESETDKKLKRIVTLLQERSSEHLGKRDIYRKLGISAREFDDLERTLIESERITKMYAGGQLYYIALS